jgi:pentatricopeptide repeat protein
MNNNPDACGTIQITALVHSYGQCGEMETAMCVFEDGVRRGMKFDVKEWTVVIAMYGEHGMMDEATRTLDRMVEAGVQPDDVTLVCLLNAASHSGLGLGIKQLLDQLQSRFPHIQIDHRHHCCVIDGLARAGLLDDAVSEVRAHVNDSVVDGCQ